MSLSGGQRHRVPLEGPCLLGSADAPPISGQRPASKFPTTTPQGFKEWPLLEDLELTQRLRGAAGRPVVVPAPVTTSGRRWGRLGFWRTLLVNQAVLAGFAAGVDVNELARLYSA